MSQNENLEKKSWIEYYINFWSITIIGLLVIGIIVFSYSYMFSKVFEEKVIFHEISLSFNKKEGTSENNINELKRIVNEYNNFVNKLNEKLKEKKEKVEKDEFQSFLTLFIAIIFSVAGFFGFKSFFDIRNSAELVAEEKAKEKAESVAKDVAGDVSEKIAKKIAKKIAELVAEEKAKEKAESVAKDVAEEVAKRIAEVKAEEVVREKYKTVIESAILDDTLMVVNNRIDDELNDIHDRLANLESGTTEPTSNLDEEENPFDKVN